MYEIETIGTYRLGKILGVGSTGKVRMATCKKTNHQVAIKIIPKNTFSQNISSLPLTEEKRSCLSKKIEREITIMKLIDHPNIMKLHDVYENETELYFYYFIIKIKIFGIGVCRRWRTI